MRTGANIPGPLDPSADQNQSQNLIYEILNSVHSLNVKFESPKKYVRPWAAPESLIVIDAYQANSINWDKMATDKKVVGVIHRSSIGMKEDSQYQSRKAIALKRGYLWGAYHLGRRGDPIGQAKFFLKIVGTSGDTMMALDLEDTSNSSMMSIAESVKFMEYVFKATGKIPVVYANHAVTQALNAALAKNALLKATQLWYARFVSDISKFPKGIWSTYFLWQFASEINCKPGGSCPYKVPGTASDMDINVFYGNREALAAQWRR
jgi:lysozyme